MTFYIFAVLAAAGLGIMAAVGDLRGMRISNIVSVLIVGAFLMAYGAAALAGVPVFDPLKAHLVTGAGMLFVTMAMFFARAFGGGDSKLCTAFAVWAGLTGLITFIFYMALAGGLLAVVALALGRLKPFKAPPAGSWINRLQSGERVIPYGVAITAGALVMFAMNGYLSPDIFRAFLGASP